MFVWVGCWVSQIWTSGVVGCIVSGCATGVATCSVEAVGCATGVTGWAAGAVGWAAGASVFVGCAGCSNGADACCKISLAPFVEKLDFKLSHSPLKNHFAFCHVSWRVSLACAHRFCTHWETVLGILFCTGWFHCWTTHPVTLFVVFFLISLRSWRRQKVSRLHIF